MYMSILQIKIMTGFRSSTKNGTFIATWGEEGEGNGQFLHTHGIDL